MTAENTDAEVSNRFVRLVCPVCGERGPVCDQKVDVRRETLFSWWGDHYRRFHKPRPIIERADGP